jgi:hypothetical protein
MAKTQGEVIPRPVLNTASVQGVWSASKPILPSMPPKRKFTLLDKTGAVVATLIDRGLAENWVAEHKHGAVKFTEGALALVV